MSYRLKRVTTTPNSPIQIQVDRPDPSGKDAGLAVEGIYRFEPAGQDGDTHQVSEHGAKTIMGDPGLAVHFECHPPLGGENSPAAQPARESRRTRPAAAPEATE